MLLSIHHTTEYQFDQPVRYALQRLKLRPKDGAGQTVRDWQLVVDGGKVEAEHDDPQLLSAARDRSIPPTITAY
jgi:transglutaminase-like putative cysteine protease